MDDVPAIFVDINIFIDVTEKRFRWSDSAAVLELVKLGRAQAYISALTKVILYFRRSRIRSDREARDDVREITDGFSIIDLTTHILDKAFDDERFKDVEDSIQFHSCISVAKILITRNKRDYSAVTEEIEVLTPEEFLKKYIA